MTTRTYKQQPWQQQKQGTQQQRWPRQQQQQRLQRIYLEMHICLSHHRRERYRTAGVSHSPSHPRPFVESSFHPFCTLDPSHRSHNHNGTWWTKINKYDCWPAPHICLVMYIIYIPVIVNRLIWFPDDIPTTRMTLPTTYRQRDWLYRRHTDHAETFTDRLYQPHTDYTYRPYINNIPITYQPHTTRQPHTDCLYWPHIDQINLLTITLCAYALARM